MMALVSIYIEISVCSMSCVVPPLTTPQHNATTAMGLKYTVCWGKVRPKNLDYIYIVDNVQRC